MKNTIESKNCHVCGSDQLEVIFEAPSLPLTGIYLPKNSSEILPTFDQLFMFCKECGHGQLRHLIAPSILYDDTYTHRTSTSAIATKGNDFFYEQLLRITKGRKFKTLLEVGCNDLYLLQKTQGLADKKIGIDPIWIGRDHELNSSTKVLGRFIEEIDIKNDVGSKPDLVISAHTFEHIQDFYGQMSALVDLADDGCLFVIEIPSFDSLVKQRRFDQVFHQHIQYTSLSSMRRLVSRLGCSFLGHTFNYGYWGGTLMFWFEKSKESLNNGLEGFELQNLGLIKKGFVDFKFTIQAAINQAMELKEKCYGFGGAQMLPILAYHMGSNLEFMDAILDDNIERNETTLPGILPGIRLPIESEMENAAIMITALDSTRPILQRLLTANPRRVMHPMQCY
jgi:hypothetical protein